MKKYHLNDEQATGIRPAATCSASFALAAMRITLAKFAGIPDSIWGYRRVANRYDRGWIQGEAQGLRLEQTSTKQTEKSHG